jgi:hypothetical protein
MAVKPTTTTQKPALYKMVSLPSFGVATATRKTSENTKVVATSYKSFITSINRMGATLNSTIIVNQQILKTINEDLKLRGEEFERMKGAFLRERAEKDIDGTDEGGKKEPWWMKAVGGIAKAVVPSFFDALAKLGEFFLRAFLVQGILKWISDPKNGKKLANIVNGLLKLFKWLSTFITENLAKTIEGLVDMFDSDKSIWERIVAFGTFITGFGSLLLGMAFLKNPGLLLKGVKFVLTTLYKNLFKSKATLAKRAAASGFGAWSAAAGGAAAAKGGGGGKGRLLSFAAGVGTAAIAGSLMSGGDETSPEPKESSAPSPNISITAPATPSSTPPATPSSSQEPSEPMLAEGGIATKPTSAIVGERGPEIKLPLNGNIPIPADNEKRRKDAGIKPLSSLGSFFGGGSKQKQQGVDQSKSGDLSKLFLAPFKGIGAGILSNISQVVSSIGGPTGKLITPILGNIIAPIANAFGVPPTVVKTIQGKVLGNVPTEISKTGSNKKDESLKKIFGRAGSVPSEQEKKFTKRNDTSVFGLLSDILGAAIVINNKLKKSSGGGGGGGSSGSGGGSSAAGADAGGAVTPGSGTPGEVLATDAKTTYYDPSLGGINASGIKTKDGLPATSTGEGYKADVFSAAAFPPLIAKLPESMTTPTADPKFPGGRTLKKPFNVIVKTADGKQAVIRVNDVGPGVEGHASNHMLDLSVAAKNYLGTGSGYTIMMADSNSKPGPLLADTTSNNKPKSTLADTTNNKNSNNQSPAKTPEPPKKANGGWISGPMSGYPVSLDGGESIAFEGHGTEWVGFKKAAGGSVSSAFVIPFDTPKTKTNPKLIETRMQQAKSGGFTMPKFAAGGFTIPKFAAGGGADPQSSRDQSNPQMKMRRKKSKKLRGFASGGELAKLDFSKTPRKYTHPRGEYARDGTCTTGVILTAEKHGANIGARDVATGNDPNNPRGLISQAVGRFGWGSIPGLGKARPIRSPYGNVTVSSMSYSEWADAVINNKIPSGALIFSSQTGWDHSGGSSGNDSAIAQDGGKKLWSGYWQHQDTKNGKTFGSVYGPSTKEVVALTHPGGNSSGFDGDSSDDSGSSGSSGGGGGGGGGDDTPEKTPEEQLQDNIKQISSTILKLSGASPTEDVTEATEKVKDEKDKAQQAVNTRINNAATQAMNNAKNAKPVDVKKAFAMEPIILPGPQQNLPIEAFNPSTSMIQYAWKVNQ